MTDRLDQPQPVIKELRDDHDEIDYLCLKEK